MDSCSLLARAWHGASCKLLPHAASCSHAHGKSAMEKMGGRLEPSHRERGKTRRSAFPGTSSQIGGRGRAGTIAGTPAELDCTGEQLDDGRVDDEARRCGAAFREAQLRKETDRMGGGAVAGTRQLAPHLLGSSDAFLSPPLALLATSPTPVLPCGGALAFEAARHGDGNQEGDGRRVP